MLYGSVPWEAVVDNSFDEGEVDVQFEIYYSAYNYEIEIVGSEVTVV
jgi:hypothetical protein